MREKMSCPSCEKWKKGPDYVLCLYCKDESRKNELAEKYTGFPGVKYRYWKSDADTRSGIYSEKYNERT
jgi:hypothetical protein